jgi:glycine dehydrogenase subunit 1
MSERELEVHMKKLAGKNRSTDELICFLGAGAYDHYIPAVVDAIVSRPEFYTSYTPYQAEISQGMLQAIFEYQTMVCELTGLDASNASMYDGASSTAEACTIAVVNSRGGNKLLVSAAVNPETRKVIATYMGGRDLVIDEIPLKDGETDYEALERLCNSQTAAVCVQSPNFFGIVEDLDRAGEIAQKCKSSFIVNTDLTALSILKAPGESGADFVTGDAQGLGNPMGFGGPHLGFFAASGKYVRKMPGRIVGQTVDKDGKTGYVLTLQAREQHIRREKATSNICSNHALNALAATVYMSTVGKKGLEEIALRCANNARYTYDKLIETGRFSPLFDKPFFKEFAVKAKTDIEKLNEELLKGGFLGGYRLEADYPGLDGGWLVAVTEKRTCEEIANFVKKAGDVG